MCDDVPIYYSPACECRTRVGAFIRHIIMFIDMMRSALKSNADHWSADKNRLRFICKNYRLIWAATCRFTVLITVTKQWCDDEPYYEIVFKGDKPYVPHSQQYYWLFAFEQPNSLERDSYIPHPWMWNMKTSINCGELGYMPVGEYVKLHMAK